jgi:hypothetical protein
MAKSGELGTARLPSKYGLAILSALGFGFALPMRDVDLVDD